HPGLYVVGDYLFDSTINGLLDSAEVVVEDILEELAAGGPALLNGSASPAHPAEAAPPNGKPVTPAAAHALPQSPPCPAPKGLAPPDHPEAPPAVVAEWDDGVVRWRPGRTVVQGRVDSPEAVLAALAAFAFYEGELRALEQALAGHEETAPADVALAHRVRSR